MSPELAKVVQDGARHVRRRGARPFDTPLPVAEFVTDGARITIDTITCVRICFWG